MARRRPAAAPLRSRPSPGAPARRPARGRDIRSRAVEPVRALHGNRRADRGVRGRSVEPVEALAEGARLDEALALVRKHSTSGALMCTHGDVMPMLLDHYASSGVDIRSNASGRRAAPGRSTPTARAKSCARYIPAATRMTHARRRLPHARLGCPDSRHREEYTCARRDRPRGPRLHAEGPRRQRRLAVVVPRQPERRDRVLPVHVHRRLRRRAVLAARRPLGVRRGEGAGARDLVRLAPRAEAVGDAAGLHVPGAQRLLAARRCRPRTACSTSNSAARTARPS